MLNRVTFVKSPHALCSEGCSAVVGVANREELVPVLIYFLQPSIFFPDILTTAGRYTLSCTLIWTQVVVVT